MFRVWTSVLIGLTLATVGCSRAPNAPNGNVAIVDLDVVAKELGLGEQWSAHLAQQQSQVNQQLAGYQKQLTEHLKHKHAELTAGGGSGNELSEVQQTQLVSYQQELNNQLQQAQTQAKQHLAGERNRLILDFRQRTERVVARVAAARGFDVVLTKNETVVLTVAPVADITADVAARLRATASPAGSASVQQSNAGSRHDSQDDFAR